MDDLLSEKEQIEQIRNWWSVYGGYVIFGAAAGALLLFGINYYQNSKLNAQLEASSLYQQLTNNVVDGALDEAEVTAGQLAASYEETPYAAQAKLAMARLYMDKNRDEEAADALRELLAGDSSEEIKHVARLRLAKILLYQEKAQDVVDLLEGEDNAAFAAVYGEVLGDAYAALERYADAEAAYQRVLMDPLAQGTVNQRLVQWKALDLPAAAPVDDAAEAATDEAPAPAEAASEAPE
ncbi:MAG: tetratricopeptide repeat protein [Gammaproteobacteria bacterium]|nr:tetratricopeptide repeat protein [Gammaproteobacteria bacterium]